VPRSSLHAYFIFILFKTFAAEQAIAQFCKEHSQFLIPASTYMPKACQLEVVYAIISIIPEPNTTAPFITDNIAFNTLCKNAPLLAD
jgi:hypothetical protein